MPLNTISELKVYKDRIVRQKAVLELSEIFLETEKKDLLECYDKLTAICDETIARELTVFDYQYL